MNDAHPKRSGKRIRVTDPLAFAVDWRLYADKAIGKDYTDDDAYPASFIKFSGGKLVICDAGGETGELPDEQNGKKLHNSVMCF